MKPEAWREVDRLYHAAQDRPVSERPVFLYESCHDADIRREVESLLSFETPDTSLFDFPAWAKGLAPGERIGPYEILRQVGAGGMGEVWKARDTRLGRDVAIKVCAERFSDRFRQEALAIAALNDPHICTLYDVGPDCLVMEYVEGSPVTGPLPVERVLQLGAQIAGALDTAHRKGIVHRDLKPANILLTSAGIKLLDFGLAKMLPDGAAYPAEATPASNEGALAGTLQYMSPEQLQGREIDARSDIFSCGCVLYEMLTGRRPFTAEDPASQIAAILKDEPAALTAPAPLARLVRKCLAKDPGDRWQSARDLRDELLWIASSEAAPVFDPTAGPRPPARIHVPVTVAALIGAVLAVIALIAVVPMLRPQPPPVSGKAIRFPLVLKEGIRDFRISPDGAAILYITDADRPLFRVYQLVTGESRPLSGLDGASDYFWSPDSRFIGFRLGKQLRKVELSTGLVSTVFDAGNGSILFHSAWTSSGGIFFFLRDHGTAWVPADGGELKIVTRLVAPELIHLGFAPLPDGHSFLFFAPINVSAPGDTLVSSTEASGRAKLMTSDSVVAYSPPGYLLFLRGDLLVAQPFDPVRLALKGTAQPLIDHVARYGTSGSGFEYLPVMSSSQTGVLVYRSGSRFRQSRLTWFDRSGTALGTLGEMADYSNPALSPDGKRLAISIRDPQSPLRDVWVFDLARGGGMRLTLGQGDHTAPVWSPDGTRIAITSSRQNSRNIYVKSVSGTIPEELLLASETYKSTESWSPDGRLYFSGSASGSPNIWFLSPSARAHTAIPFRSTPFAEQDSAFSKDGKFIAYQSNESGRMEVFAQRLMTGGARWQISTNSGQEPQWRGDGKEMYYVERNNLMAVGIRIDGDTLSAGIPHPLFKVPPGFNHRNRYVVTGDGQRFLVVVPEEQGPPPPPVVVVNWPALLSKK